VKKAKAATVQTLMQEAREAAYKAVVGIYEKAEGLKLIFGNGHHMAQRIGESAAALLHERSWREEGLLNMCQLEVRMSRADLDWIEATFGADLSEGAYVVNCKSGSDVNCNDLRDIWGRLPDEADGQFSIIVARAFEQSAIEFAYEHEDVVLCTEKGGKWKVVKDI
jgi:hypothetical protein